MKLTEIISDDTIVENLRSSEKKDVIEEMLQVLVQTGNIRKEDAASVQRALLKREELGSTGIGHGIAVPHAKHASIKRLVAAFGRSKKGIEYDALDGKPVYLVFLLVTPKGEAGIHLEALAYIARLLKDDAFCRIMKDAKDLDELKALIRESDGRLGG